MIRADLEANLYGVHTLFAHGDLHALDQNRSVIKAREWLRSFAKIPVQQHVWLGLCPQALVS
jgi:hypothetical protein